MRAFSEGDENTARDMGAFVQSYDRLRESTGAHVMGIHHRGANASHGLRVSGSLLAAVDTENRSPGSGIVIYAETDERYLPLVRLKLRIIVQ